MRAAIISLGSMSSKWTTQAMKKYFGVVEEIDIRDLEVNLSSDGAQVLYHGKPLGDFDCIYLKASYKYVRLLSSITSALEGRSYMPIRADTFAIGHDKLLTHLKLQEKKIPMPSTYLSATPAAAKQLLEKLNYPIVMKFPEGTQGKGVMFADSFSSASSMLDALAALNQPVIIQEYVDTGGTDIRAIVIGDRVVAAMRRKAVEGEKRANIHAGGEGEPCELDGKTQQLAVRTAQAIGADICAVDILEGKKGALVIEVNLSPGLQGITAATQVNVADAIATFLYERTKRFVEGEISGETSRIMSGLDNQNRSKIISNLDFRGNRMLLPDFVSDMSGLKAGDEVTITAEKNSVILSKTNGKPVAKPEKSSEKKKR